MLEAVPYRFTVSHSALTKSNTGKKRTNSSANIFAARDTWSLGAITKSLATRHATLEGYGKHTDNQRNHRGSISSGGFKTLDELLDLPDFNILLRVVRSLSRAHVGRGDQGYTRPG